MKYKFSIIILLLMTSAAHCSETIIKTENNEFTISYNYHKAVRIIPHGLIDQAKDHIIALYGAEKLLSFERSFHIGENSYGYIVHKNTEGISLYLIACSKGNESFVSVSGIVKKGEWKYEVIKLLELSTKALDEYDKNNKRTT